MHEAVKKWSMGGRAPGRQEPEKHQCDTGGDRTAKEDQNISGVFGEFIMEEIIQQDTEQQREPMGPESRPETPEVFQKLVKHCTDLYDLFSKSEYREKKLKEITEARNVYDQKEEQRKTHFENASNLCLPLTTITVDNQEPRFVSALVGKSPIVNFTMEGMEKKDPGTLVVEDFFNKELQHNVKIENYTMGHIHQLLLEGTVFCIPEYSLDEKVVRDFVFDQNGNIVMKSVDVPVPVIDPMTGTPIIGPDMQPLMTVQKQETGEPEIQDQTIVEREGGKIEIVPFTDMFYADNLGTIDEWETADKIRGVNPTYAELMKKKDELGYQNIGPWLFEERSGKDITELDKTTITQSDLGKVITGKETIECIECHITYPIYRDDTKEEREQNDFTEERIIVTIALRSKTVIRLVLNRELVFTNTSLVKRSRLYPEHNLSCGTPVYGKLKSIQNGCSDMFNAIIDIAYVTMVPWFFFDQRAGLKGEVKLYPGKGVGVDNVQGIMIPQFRINPSQYIDFVNLFMSMWERVGNLSDWNMGVTNQAGGKKTASEVLAVIQEGNISHNYRANTMRDEFILILKTLYDLYYQFMPLDKKFIYQGQEIQIPRQAMKRDYKFNLSGSTDTANKMIERKTSEDLMGLFANDPLIDPIKPRERVLKTYEVDDLSEWINPMAKQLIDALVANPEIPQVVGQYLQKKAVMQAVQEEQSKGPGSIPSQVKAAAGGMQ